ncbi:GNAT family N-acetyltransferase [Candidatus Lokiarchaeum ossiferum]|uniref:GNAT family N-acetyltransferase n=1 Tax=Candidatus Lokiarchaeum ossiferum TaxID=2951803 RepID=UPI00352EE510
MKNVKIRAISINDCDAITSLTNQLGSDVSSDVVKEQMNEILKKSDHFAFVAVLKDQVVGYIHCFTAIRLTSKPFIEICGLVVNEKERGNGIGKLLVEHIEGLFNENNKIRVRCNSKRKLAHNFYHNLNYNLRKEQKIFEKNIS